MRQSPAPAGFFRGLRAITALEFVPISYQFVEVRPSAAPLPFSGGSTLLDGASRSRSPRDGTKKDDDDCKGTGRLAQPVDQAIKRVRASTASPSRKHGRKRTPRH